ncbi:MAG: hypothetical protein Q7W51_08345 [Coriobacteriia bacterium]|nr:hypothetical protein [Coriobacteriia bacterium]
MDEIRFSQFAAPWRDEKTRLDWKTATALFGSPNWQELELSTTSEVLFSLRGIDYLNPDGLLWVLLLGERARQVDRNRTLWLELPHEGASLRYLKESAFAAVSSEVFMLSNPYDLDRVDVPAPRRGLRFYRVDIDSLGSVVSDVGCLLTSSEFLKGLGIVPFDEVAFEYVPPFLGVVSETTKNVVQHSHSTLSGGRGYIVIGEMRTGVTRICIGDAGRGLRSSLDAKGANVADDAAAIEGALLYHYANPEGEGLFRVLQLVSFLEGAIRIRSGAREVFLDLSNDYLRTEDETRSFIEEKARYHKCANFPGVQVMIDVRRPREKR